MQSMALILAGVAIVSIGLWLVQAWRMLAFCRAQVAEAWQALQSELAARREMIPYVVAGAPPDASALIDVIGNACDLAANVQGVRECSQAEARLGAALARLVALLNDMPASAAPTVAPLSARLMQTEARVALLRGIYNRQVETFNLLLDRAAGRLLASAQCFTKADSF